MVIERTCRVTQICIHFLCVYVCVTAMNIWGTYGYIVYMGSPRIEKEFSFPRLRLQGPTHVSVYEVHDVLSATLCE